MTVSDSVLQKLQTLPADKQRQVLDYVESLLSPAPETSAPRRSPDGLWARLTLDISADEIDENRRELFAQFPRDDF